ncbi:hypothetical protein TVAGG3_0037220 [Trichomonas vaginalis G3]|uniref:hypothetical protein n=1 Tax=Trichomonas vaginalis (strain ATCC PRA-98 / G3) TaxID=412133 RepID=UPI0021E5F0B2|nr:hypothetical protein TVAGG3_0037220 [Trichomonas vaginalis G3]KAI5540473.1 hypothetical protein TVAGG3_0037220 [Trichomonas vaginalis G3]
MILFVLCVQNGIEYSADGRVLLRAPDNFNGDIVVPQEVVTIGTSSELVGSPFFKCKDNLRSLSSSLHRKFRTSAVSVSVNLR